MSSKGQSLPDPDTGIEMKCSKCGIEIPERSPKYKACEPYFCGPTCQRIYHHDRYQCDHSYPDEIDEIIEEVWS